MNDATAEDIAQDAWVKVIEHTESIHPTETDLRRYAWVVARNGAIDWQRRQRFVGPVPPQEPPSVNDLGEEVESRIAWAETCTAISALSEGDRALLAQAVGGVGHHTVVERVQLYRVRMKLRAKIEGLIAAIPLLRWRPRACWDSALTRIGGVLATATAIVGTSVLVHGVHEDRPSPRAQSPALTAVPVSGDSVESARHLAASIRRSGSGPSPPPGRRGVSSAVDVAWPLPHHTVEVPGPSGQPAAAVGTSERGDRTAIACFGPFPGLGNVCADPAHLPRP